MAKDKLISMSPALVLRFRNGFIRPLNAQDVHQGYVDGLNNPFVNRYLEVRHTKQTLGNVAEFVELHEKSSNSFLFGIWINENINHIGTIRLHGINLDPGKCSIGICIFCQSAWGKGIGSMAIREATSFGFNKLGLFSVEAHAYFENLASIRTFLKAGYRRQPDKVKNVAGKLITHAVLVAEADQYS